MGARPLFLAVVPMVLGMSPACAHTARSEADVLLDRGLAFSRQGDSAKALDCLSRARSLYRLSGDSRGEAAALAYLAMIQEDLGHPGQALRACEEALPLLHAARDKPAEATLLGMLGRLSSAMGDKAKALAYFQQALELRHSLGDRAGEAAALNDLARVAGDLGRTEQALAFNQQALQRELDKPPSPAPRWADKASLSFVDVGGNAVSQTIGLANELTYRWSEAGTLTFNLQAVRIATHSTTYSAEGSSPASFTLATERTDQVTTADYLSRLRFAEDLGRGFLAFTEGGWERNIPAGIKDRTAGSAGLGYWWISTDTCKVRTDLGAGYTHAEPVTPAPGFQIGYGTWNGAASYDQKIGASAAFASRLNGAFDTGDLANYLAVWTNDFTTSLTRRLSLKVGYSLTYNNRPASQAVPIVLGGSVPPVVLGHAFVTLKKLDSQFLTSLVISF